MEVMKCYIERKKVGLSVGVIAKAAAKFMSGTGGTEKGILNDDESSHGSAENIFLDFEDLLSDGDTVISRMNNINDSDAKVLAVNSLRRHLGETMGAYFLSSQTCMIRRAVQSSIEVRSAVQQRKAEAKKRFAKIDQDGDGVLTLQEVVEGATILGLSEAEELEFFKKLDVDKSGTVDMDEFLECAFLETEDNTAIKVEENVEKMMLPIDDRPAGSSHILSVDTKKLNMQRKVEEEDNRHRDNRVTKKRTTVFGWSLERQKDSDTGEGAKDGMISFLNGTNLNVLQTSRWKEFGEDDVASSLQSTKSICAGTAKDVHSSILYDTFKNMNSRPSILLDAPHRKACAAFLNECNRLKILPKPILDYFTARPDYDVDDNSDDFCVCGRNFTYYSHYCLGCGNKRPTRIVQPPVIGPNTFPVCECGFRHGGLAKFCMKCGCKRAEPRPELHDNLQCECSNYFLTDSRYCRKCGASRPEVEDGTLQQNSSSNDNEEDTRSEEDDSLFALPKELLEKVPEEDRQRWKNKFCEMDSSGDGYLDAEELGVLLEELFPDENKFNDRKSIEKLIASVDEDGNGKLYYFVTVSCVLLPYLNYFCV